MYELHVRHLNSKSEENKTRYSCEERPRTLREAFRRERERERVEREMKTSEDGVRQSEPKRSEFVTSSEHCS